MKLMDAVYRYPKRRAYQLGLMPTSDPCVVGVESNAATPFYALWLGVAPAWYAAVELRKNGAPVASGDGKVLDAAWFARWKYPPFINLEWEKMNVYRLRENGVYLIVKPGERVELAARWEGDGIAPELRGALMGFIEEDEAPKGKVRKSGKGRRAK